MLIVIENVDNCWDADRCLGSGSVLSGAVALKSRASVVSAFGSLG